jgi:hypothetical protein
VIVVDWFAAIASRTGATGKSHRANASHLP